MLPRPSCSIKMSTEIFGFENAGFSLSGFGVKRTLAVEVIGPKTERNSDVELELQLN